MNTPKVGTIRYLDQVKEIKKAMEYFAPDKKPGSVNVVMNLFASDPAYSRMAILTAAKEYFK